MKLTGILYETTAKLVKVVRNLLFTVPAKVVPEQEFCPTPITAKPNTECYYF